MTLSSFSQWYVVNASSTHLLSELCLEHLSFRPETVLMIEQGLLHRSHHLRLYQYVKTGLETDRHRLDLILTMVKA